MIDEPQESDALTITSDQKEEMFNVIVSITHQLSKMDEARAEMNSIAEHAQGNFGVKKKYFTKMAKVMYAKTFNDVQEEAAHFEALYEMIVGDKGDQYAKD